MVNNSSLDRWNRLRKKSRDQQFTNMIIHGLNCSPFEASAILDTVYDVFGDCLQTSSALMPGQMRLQVLDVEARIGQSISQSEQTTVTLTINNDKEDFNIRKQQGVTALRRHQIQRICQEAFDQGGLLTVEDLAYRIFNCGERTICRDLAHFRNNDVFIPLRSTVKDIGRTLSHRLLIIKLWAQGKEYSEISRQTCHSLGAIQNYVDKFKRTISLYKEGYDTTRIAFLLKLSAPLVQDYINLYDKLNLVDHRKKELNTFLKKDSLSNNRRVRP